MFKAIIIQITLMVIAVGCTSIAQDVSDSKPITHEQWTTLLAQHVTEDGLVDYAGFKADSERLDTYLELLLNNHPNTTHWSDNERMAYWINAYNAFTVKLVSDNHPVESIKDIKKGIPMVNSVWDIKFIEIEGEVYDLNNIEHGILRKEFEEPRIHFAVNCASVSCPVLLNEAFEANTLEQQLQQQAIAFINDPVRNTIKSNAVEVSKIFSWFKGDFTSEGSLIDFLNLYSHTAIDKKAKVSFRDYDWNLNE